jgi:hypothetical protein
MPLVLRASPKASLAHITILVVAGLAGGCVRGVPRCACDAPRFCSPEYVAACTDADATHDAATD